MGMKLCLITDAADFARDAEEAGIERVMIDLERDGKAERQAGRQLFLSSHTLASVAPLKSALRRSALVARVNPLSERSASEIDAVIGAGADFVMLPYFFHAGQVRQFVELVRGRSGVILLVETRAAAGSLDEILRVRGIDEVHIGLNDLSISLGHSTLFGPIRTGLIDRLTATLRQSGLPFGFGGVGRLSQTGAPISPERFLAMQVHAGAARAWLGRTFRGQMEKSRVSGELAAEVALIRAAIDKWSLASEEEAAANARALHEEIVMWETLPARSVSSR